MEKGWGRGENFEFPKGNQAESALIEAWEAE